MNFLQKIILLTQVCNLYSMKKSIQINQYSWLDDIASITFNITFNENVPSQDRLPIPLKQQGTIDDKIRLWKKIAHQYPSSNNLCTMIVEMPLSHKLIRDTDIAFYYTTISNEVQSLHRSGIIDEKSKMHMTLSFIRMALSSPGCFDIFGQNFIENSCASGLDNKEDIQKFIDCFKNCSIDKAKIFATLFLFYKDQAV